jgi:hypothetical protein
MSALACNPEARRRAAAQVVLRSGRTRRADAGALTEMARELLHEAHEADRRRGSRAAPLPVVLAPAAAGPVPIAGRRVAGGLRAAAEPAAA